MYTNTTPMVHSVAMLWGLYNWQSHLNTNLGLTGHVATVKPGVIV